MLIARKSADRGHFDHGWLDTYHSFSFASYHDEQHMGFRSLRVINEDVIAGGAGFGMHPHRNMEILTYMVDGALEHRDSMGNGSVISPGEIQLMSAGRGVHHSEFNHSAAEPAKLLQIWITPDQTGTQPGYQQMRISREPNVLQLIASPDGKDGSMRILQDARVYALRLEKGRSIEKSLEPGRYGWIQLISGSLDVNGSAIEAGDGLAASGEKSLAVSAKETSELLIFDLS